MKKKINKLGFMRLLGLLGVGGLMAGQNEYVGFLGFFGYVAYFNVIPDELFRTNVNTAASSGFFSGLAVTVFLIMLNLFIGDNSLQALALALGFSTALVVFSFVLVYRVYKEERGAKICD